MASLGCRTLSHRVTDRERIERAIPALRTSPYTITSQPDKWYNCTAWALGIVHVRVDPFDRWGSWPPDVPRENSVESVSAVFAHAGYEHCEDGALVDGTEKVALYAHSGLVQHVARQLESGRWTSKLGDDCDIEHELEALASSANVGGGVQYGEVVAYMSRARAG